MNNQEQMNKQLSRDSFLHVEIAKDYLAGRETLGNIRNAIRQLKKAEDCEVLRLSADYERYCEKREAANIVPLSFDDWYAGKGGAL